MTTLIEKIQAEIDRAAEYSTPDNSILVMSRDHIIAGYRDEFVKGAAFLLPLLKKCLEQRGKLTWLHYDDDSRLNKLTSFQIEEINNKELLKLIGVEHE